MKVACMLLSVLALAYSAPADEAGSCVSGVSSNAADAKVVESVNKNCDGNSDLVACHKQQWNKQLEASQAYLTFLDQVNIALAACPQAADEKACTGEALHQLESYYQQIQTDELGQSVENPSEKCQGESGYSTCYLAQLENVKDAKENSMAAINEILGKLSNC